MADAAWNASWHGRAEKKQISIGESQVSYDHTFHGSGAVREVFEGAGESLATV
jgi:hypothetical protein